MKQRDHDTEPGPVPIVTPRSEPRQSVSRRSGGAAIEAAHVSYASDTEIGSPLEEADTIPPAHEADTIPPAGEPVRAGYESDSIDEGIRAMSRRPLVFPVSLEPGRQEHVPARLPAASFDDTLPPLRKVIVDTPTDPGERPAPREPEPPVPPPLRRPAVILLLVSIALGITVVAGLAAWLNAKRSDTTATATRRMGATPPATLVLPGVSAASHPAQSYEVEPPSSSATTAAPAGAPSAAAVPPQDDAHKSNRGLARPSPSSATPPKQPAATSPPKQPAAPPAAPFLNPDL